MFTLEVVISKMEYTTYAFRKLKETPPTPTFSGSVVLETGYFNPAGSRQL